MRALAFACERRQFGSRIVDFQGIEFMLANRAGYFEMAYDFGRKFDQSESINFHYITQEMQHSKPFEMFLLSLHLGFLVIFLFTKWLSFSSVSGLLEAVRLWPINFEKRRLNPFNTLLIILTSNFIGMACSRGTHQQFYAWYSFSFPFLLSACDETFGPLAQFAIQISLDIAWSAPKPYNALQGHVLNISHLLIIYGLLRRSKDSPYLQEEEGENETNIKSLK